VRLRGVLFFFRHVAWLRNGRIGQVTEAGYSLPFSGCGRTGNKRMVVVKVEGIKDAHHGAVC